MEPRGRWSLAGGSLLDVSPADAVEVAAEAGFDALGLRITGTEVDGPAVREAEKRRAQLGLTVLDVEFARLTPDGRHDDGNRRLIELAAFVGADHLLTVSLDDDEARCAASFAALAEQAEGTGTRLALEFMRFSGVPSLAAARRIIERSGRNDVTVLVDTLHLARAGETAADVAATPPRLLRYAQLCDAPAQGSDDLAELGHEARHTRLLPGHGGLPLRDVLAALPDGIDLSIEVLADELAALPAAERATKIHDATQHFFEETAPRA